MGLIAPASSVALLIGEIGEVVMRWAWAIKAKVLLIY